MLDAREICGFADYFVICSADTERQIKAIAEEIETVLKKAGVRPYYIEGTSDSGWVLLDYGDVIIHIFTPTERKFYDLDELWSQANPLVRIQ
ncbi:MAG: ribosome silencing factor [Chloroflexota bacterium]